MHNHQTTPLQNQKRTKKQLKKSISQNELMSTHCYLQHQQQLHLQERVMKRMRKRSEPIMSKAMNI